MRRILLSVLCLAILLFPTTSHGQSGPYRLHVPVVAQGQALDIIGLRITALNHLGRDEYVEITNQGYVFAYMADVRLVSVVGGQEFVFPDFTLAVGDAVRVHSGPDAIDQPPKDLRWSGANYVWNDDGDEAQLFGYGGLLLDSFRY